MTHCDMTVQEVRATQMNIDCDRDLMGRSMSSSVGAKTSIHLLLNHIPPCIVDEDSTLLHQL